LIRQHVRGISEVVSEVVKRQYIHNRRMMARTEGCLTAVRGRGSVVCSDLNWLDESHAESTHRVYMYLVYNLRTVILTSAILFD